MRGKVQRLVVQLEMPLSNHYAMLLEEAYCHIKCTASRKPTDIFVNKGRALLAKLPSTDVPLSLKSQIDIIYGLLNRRIRKNLHRDSVDSFETLIDKTRSIEAGFTDSVTEITIKDEKKVKTLRPKCTFCTSFGHTVSKCHKRELKENKQLQTPSTFTPYTARSKATYSCYGCGLPGYIRNNCPQCNQSTLLVSTQSNAINLLSADIITDLSDDRPLLGVTIEGLTGLATIDTGAKCSVAGERLLQHFKSRFLLLTANRDKSMRYGSTFMFVDEPYVILRRVSPTTYQVASETQRTRRLERLMCRITAVLWRTTDAPAFPILPIRKRERPRKNPIKPDAISSLVVLDSDRDVTESKGGDL
ncbi:hypothetical protein FQR65_LT14403 [Abscondita terminalis]|nr:hypothetical protein FQR65_LT14403 [Abscondita terminalis]